MCCADDGVSTLKHPESPAAAVPAESDADQDNETAVRSLEAESEGLWAKAPVQAALTLTMPLWLTGIVLAVTAATAGAAAARRLILAGAAAAVAGRLIIWGGDSEASLRYTSGQYALVVFYLDFIWAVVLTWHVGFLFHLPCVGDRLRSAVAEGSLLLKRNRWMKRLTILGVLAFVMLPISSTGSIGGSVLGRLLGLGRAGTLATVLCGSVLGGLVMWWGAEALAPLFRSQGPMFQWGVIGILFGIGYILARRYRRSLSDSELP